MAQRQQVITNQGAFAPPTISQINANFSALFGALFSVGNIFYLDPLNGSDTSGDGSSAKPFKTLSVAYNACVGGHNDVVVLIADGTTSSTARVDSAFTWSKNDTHLLGWCSPTLFSQRSRIAPTGATTAFKPFFTVSGNGCIFQNIQWFHGFNTGTTAQICMTVTGSRNVFKSCHFAGMGDAESAVDAGSRSLKIGAAGSGENLFEDCVIGVDTGTKRTGANASVELAGGTPRNVFRRCLFPFWCSATSPLGILATGNASIDRFQVFDSCLFVNNIKSGGGSAMAVLVSCTTAAPGGLIVFHNCATVGVTAMGDTNGLLNSYIDNAVPNAAGAVAINPS